MDVGTTIDVQFSGRPLAFPSNKHQGISASQTEKLRLNMDPGNLTNAKF